MGVIVLPEEHSPSPLPVVMVRMDEDCGITVTSTIKNNLQVILMLNSAVALCLNQLAQYAATANDNVCV